MSKKLPRPRIQRAFVRWFRENHTRFAVPVRLSKITAKGILLNFPNHSDCLSVWLSSWNLSVHVEWQGVNWDMLISLDANPEPVPGGYRCRCCSESDRVWPNRESLWADHLFEPFLSWVNERLAHACQLSLYGKPGDSTWAELIDEQDDLPEPGSFWMSIPFPNAPTRLPADYDTNNALKLNGRARAQRVEILLGSLIPLG